MTPVNIEYFSFDILSLHRLSMSWKNFNVARSQRGKYVLDGGSLAGGSMASGCRTNLALAASRWLILQWKREVRFLACSVAVPFMRCFRFRYLSLIAYPLPGFVKQTETAFEDSANVYIPSVSTMSF